MTNENLTPLMRQYWDIKTLHQDKVLLFRMGDFFEMFFDDAVKAAPILGIALTSRNKKSQEETPMCGVPHHAIAGPINKLLGHGLKVAICDQVEDPKNAKGIVKRAVTRVLTPGMVYDPDMIDGTKALYLACWEDNSLACLDISTGEAFVLPNVSREDLQRLLNILPIMEIVAARFDSEDRLPVNITKSVHEGLAEENHPLLAEFVGVAELKAPRRLLSYVQASTGPDTMKTLQSFEWREVQGRMDLNVTTIRHLELFQNSRGEAAGSLFAVLNRTQTSAGSRLLRSRLCFPLTSTAPIEVRLAAVEKWLADLPRCKKIREQLAKMGDIERRLGKISQPQCGGRDLRALAESTLAAAGALQIADPSAEPADDAIALVREILTTVVEEPPLSTRQGFLIQKGIQPALTVPL